MKVLGMVSENLTVNPSCFSKGGELENCHSQSSQISLGEGESHFIANLSGVKFTKCLAVFYGKSHLDDYGHNNRSLNFDAST